MEIKNLLNVDPEKIYAAFREAFLNYFVPFNSTYEETKTRWEHAGVNLKFSYGAFDGDKLVAFILNSKIDTTLYNFAMGVIPSHRGLHLIEKIFPSLPVDHERYVLEVIKENVKAINLYTKLGYRSVRELDSFHGVLELPSIKKSAVYDVTKFQESEETKAIRLFRPSSESSAVNLSRMNFCETHSLKVDGKMVAYAHFIPKTLSIKEVGATDDRYLDLLLHEMKLAGEKLRLMNIDTNSSRFIHYLEARGLKYFIGQYEMVREVPLESGSDNR